jgi:hypothetical protein
VTFKPERASVYVGTSIPVKLNPVRISVQVSRLNESSAYTSSQAYVYVGKLNPVHASRSLLVLARYKYRGYIESRVCIRVAGVCERRYIIQCGYESRTCVYAGTNVAVK